MGQPTPFHPTSTVAQKSQLWADSVPLNWKPYIQLTRIDLFAGSLLLYWPCTWGLSLVAIKANMPPLEYFTQCLLFLVWSILLHSAGSTWNDICDKDYDRLVERTKNRPLAIGTISVTSALLWMFPQLLVLCGILCQFQKEGLLLGLFEIFFLTTIYPFLKRVTYWPQAWLGIAFTWGALISWAAHSTPEWHVLAALLYTGCSWTIYYDTIYAMMDKKDDVKAGIKSTAVLFGGHARLALSVFALNFLLGLLGVGIVTRQSAAYFLLSVLGSACHLTWQITTLVLEDPSSCLRRFKSNGTQLGYIIWSGLVVTYILHVARRDSVGL